MESARCARRDTTPGGRYIFSTSNSFTRDAARRAGILDVWRREETCRQRRTGDCLLKGRGDSRSAQGIGTNVVTQIAIVVEGYRRPAAEQGAGARPTPIIAGGEDARRGGECPTKLAFFNLGQVALELMRHRRRPVTCRSADRSAGATSRSTSRGRMK